MRVVLLAALMGLSLAGRVAAEERFASDFEIATAKRALAAATTPLSKIAAHLNLGDLRASRAELTLADEHFRRAAGIATEAGAAARRHSDLEAYATAVAYRGLALAKLGDAGAAFSALEEALRYHSDSARTWNLYASAMTVLRMPRKAESAARNAVGIAQESLEISGTVSNRLDLEIYRYALAAALMAGDPRSGEAEAILRSILESLESPAFEPLRRRIADEERFEIFSSVRGDADAWLALLNRSALGLGRLLEGRGDVEGAEAVHRRSLIRRSDDPLATAALARLSATEESREKWYGEAFAANPFSASLIADYQAYVGNGSPEPGGSGVAGLMQRAIWLVGRGEANDAEPIARELSRLHPDNESVAWLRGKVAFEGGRVGEAETIASTSDTDLFRSLRAEIREWRLSRTAALEFLERHEGSLIRDPEPALLLDLVAVLPDRDPAIRRTLDSFSFSSLARFDDPLTGPDRTTILSSGTIGGVPFRFNIPTAFRGEFPAGALRLEYRIGGSTGNRLLLEPIRVEAP